MGSYVNPGGWPRKDLNARSKEEFLTEHGIALPSAPLWDEVPRGMLPVCWVSNGTFTAAGIAYCPKELDEFINDMAGRPNRWFFVETAELVKVSNLSDPYYWSKIPARHQIEEEA